MSPSALACPASLKGVLSAREAAEALVEGAFQRDPAPVRPLSHQDQGVIDGAREVEVCRLQLHPPGLDLGQVEDVVDQ